MASPPAQSLENGLPKTPARPKATSGNGTSNSIATSIPEYNSTPQNKLGSASLARVNVDGRLRDVATAFQNDLKARATHAELVDFLLFLLSFKAPNDDKETLRATLDSLLNLSLDICEEPKRSNRKSARLPCSLSCMLFTAERLSDLHDNAIATRNLRAEWAGYLEEYGCQTLEVARYAPFAKLANSILKSLSEDDTRKRLGALKLSRCKNDDHRVIFQRNDPRQISTTYVGLDGAPLGDAVQRKPDIVLLGLGDAVPLCPCDKRRCKLKEAKTDAFQHHAFHHAHRSPTTAPAFSDVKMCFEFKRHKLVRLRASTLPSKIQDPKSIPQQPVDQSLEGLEYMDVPTPKDSETKTNEDEFHAGMKRTYPSVSGASMSSSKRAKMGDLDPAKLPASIKSAIYAGGKLSASPALHHTLGAVIEDDIMWLWWYDRGGAVQSYGLNFFEDFPYFVAFLAIIDAFDEQDFGLHAGFKPSIGINKVIESLEFTLQGEGTETSNPQFKVDTQAFQHRMQYALFGRNTVVLPTTSSSANPLKPETSLSDVRMVAKIYYPEQSRTNEVDLLKIAYSIADYADDEEDRAFVKGHLPVLVASQTWGNEYSDRIDKVLQPKEPLKLIQRNLRILVFYELKPIHHLRGEQFVKAFMDCFFCHRGLAKNGLLHRDISMYNLMYYETPDGQAVGVLIDYDLSIIEEYPRNKSMERTGTLAFMAHDLLINMTELEGIQHLYEYDVESFYYVLLWITATYDGPDNPSRHDLRCEWMFPTDPLRIAASKAKYVKEPQSHKPTPGHEGIFRLIRNFSRIVFTCLDDQSSHAKAIVVLRQEIDGLELDNAQCNALDEEEARETQAMLATKQKELSLLRDREQSPQRSNRAAYIFDRVDQVFYVHQNPHLQRRFNLNSGQLPASVWNERQRSFIPNAGVTQSVSADGQSSSTSKSQVTLPSKTAVGLATTSVTVGDVDANEALPEADPTVQPRRNKAVYQWSDICRLSTTLANAADLAIAFAVQREDEGKHGNVLAYHGRNLSNAVQRSLRRKEDLQKCSARIGSSVCATSELSVPSPVASRSSA